MENDIKNIKELSLRMLLEEHLYSIGESDSFHFAHTEYKVERKAEGFSISRWVGDGYANEKFFSTLGKLFNHFFITNGIR